MGKEVCESWQEWGTILGHKSGAAGLGVGKEKVKVYSGMEGVIDPHCSKVESRMDSPKLSSRCLWRCVA